MTLEEKIDYIKESIHFNTQNDIYTLPRVEFIKEVDRCRKDAIPQGAIPFIILFLLLEEQESLNYKIKKALKKLFKKVFK